MPHSFSPGGVASLAQRLVVELVDRGELDEPVEVEVIPAHPRAEGYSARFESRSPKGRSVWVEVYVGKDGFASIGVYLDEELKQPARSRGRHSFDYQAPLDVWEMASDLFYQGKKIDEERG